MAWTAPRTWVDGEVPNAALLNTHVRDNLETVSPTSLRSEYVQVVNEAIYLNTYPGVDPTGVADSTTAVQAAINSIPQTGTTRGGRLKLGLNTNIKIAGQLDLSQKENISIEGPGSMPRSYSPAQFTFTRADGVSCVKLGSCNGVRFKGLRLENTSSAYSGSMVDTRSVVVADAQMVGFEDVAFKIAGSSGVLLDLLHSVGATIRRSHFSFGAIAIRGFSDTTGLPIAAGYAIGVTIDGQCQFGNQSNAALFNPSYDWNIVGNIFSPGAGGIPNGLKHDGTGSARGMALIGNYFGDAGVAGNYANVFAEGAHIAGNYFDGDLCTGLFLSRPSYGVVVSGNTFALRGAGGVGIDCGPTGSPSLGVVVQGNMMNLCTTKIQNHTAANQQVALLGNYGVTDRLGVDAVDFPGATRFGPAASGSTFDLSGNLTMQINRTADLSHAKVRDQLSAGFTSAGTTLGSVVRRMPVYAADGTTLLGYMPIYNTIT